MEDLYRQSSGRHSSVSSSVSPTRGLAALHISPKPSKRSSSLKKPRKKHLDNVELSEIRPRTSSLPSRNCLQKPRPQYLSPFIDNISEQECYTMRTFVTTRKGLINRGDSVRSRSTNSIASSASSSMTELTPLSGTNSSSLSNSVNSLLPAFIFRVLVLGWSGVGKSSLKRQFMTSEYLGVVDSIDGESDSNVSVMLDGEESSVDFIDPAPDMDWRAQTTIDAYIIVFAIDDRTSFEKATDILYELKQRAETDNAIILVANKCDLVRTRVVSTEESKSIATMYDCKFVETSVVLNHNVDDLLVGIISQIRRKKHRHGAMGSDEHGCYSKSKNLLSKIFKRDPMSKSCEKLYGP